MSTLEEQTRALQQAARDLNNYQENKDKPPHQRWVDPRKKLTKEQQQKAQKTIDWATKGMPDENNELTAEGRSYMPQQFSLDNVQTNDDLEAKSWSLLDGR